MLLPYFVDNNMVKEIYEVSDNDFVKEEFKILKHYFDNPGVDLPYRYHTGSGSGPDVVAMNFSENVWSKRLCGALRLLAPKYKDHIHFTALSLGWYRN